MDNFSRAITIIDDILNEKIINENDLIWLRSFIEELEQKEIDRREAHLAHV